MPRTSDDIKKAIAKLQEELKEAQAWEQNIKSGSPIAFADLLHSKRCPLNHTDQCAWYHETWDQPGYDRNAYLTRATALLAKAKTLGVDPMVIISAPYKYAVNR